jgi:hypothetical protein
MEWRDYEIRHDGKIYTQTLFFFGDENVEDVLTSDIYFGGGNVGIKLIATHKCPSCESDDLCQSHHMECPYGCLHDREKCDVCCMDC